MRVASRVAGGVIIVALLAFLFYPTFRWLIVSWLNNPYYSHGFLIPLVSGFFFWRRREVLAWERREPNYWGLIPLVLALLAHLAAVPWQAFYISAFSFLALLGGLLLFFWGTSAIKKLLFPLAFLLFMIPLPFVDRFSPALESFAATYATRLAQMSGLPAHNLGSQISLAGSTFVVAAPCSGLNSLVALFALAAVMTYLFSGPLLGKIIILAVSIPVALVANLIRLFSLLWVAHLFGEGAGMTYFHNFSSPVLFLSAFILLILIGRLVGCHGFREDI
ncbi:MAG: exosortase/archaeosortase family protein [Anaerolineae bacterium]|nr:exosortase/archaeosortase family protein [Anaerolineae bacterium]